MGSIDSIAYGNGTFVAVGSGLNGEGEIAASTTNGATWEAIDVSNIFGNSTVNGIVYGGNMFVAGGGDGKIATSTNGTTWTAVADRTVWKFENIDGYNSIKAIAYGNGKFVAGSDSKTATSTNGTTWTAVDSTVWKYGQINAIAYGNGKFVAVGAFGTIAYWQP